VVIVARWIGSQDIFLNALYQFVTGQQRIGGQAFEARRGSVAALACSSAAGNPAGRAGASAAATKVF